MLPLRSYFRRLVENHERGFVTVLLAPFLELASLLYGCAVRTVRGFYEKRILPRKKFAFPVVSVGNLTWGGTGKTPLVEYLTHKLSDRHRRVLILSRGYGSDEVEQFRRHLPKAVIGVGKDRAKVAAEISAKEKIDLAVLDDGFQHWAIERDLEVVTLNALNPFGSKKLIPRGILREPITALKRAAVIVITHTNLVARDTLDSLKGTLRAASPASLIVEAFLEPLFFYRAQKRVRVPLSRLAGQRVTTFSAIANPRSFQLLLGRLEIKPLRNFEFTDHHPFSRQELEEIKAVSLSASCSEVITTEKDFCRTPAMITETLNPLVLATRLRIASGEGQLLERIFRLVEGRQRS